MTLESTINKNRYIGNGATTQFPFTFKIWKTDQILVYVGDGTTEQEVSAQCTVNITASGGSVTFPTAPASGTIIVLRRNMPYIQEDDYRNGARFDGEEIEDRLDMDCAERQDLKLDVSRAVKVPETSPLGPEAFWGDLATWRQDCLGALATAGDVTGATLVTAAGTTTPRSIAQRLADVVNVKDYGARGDGVADDTAAFTAAQNSGAQAVMVPNGTYKITEDVAGTFFSFGEIATTGGGDVEIIDVLSFDSIPTGTVLWLSTPSVPAGYLLCNGSAVGRATYPELFTAIGTTYGAGDGSTTFNLPNLIDKFAEGGTVAGAVKNAGLPDITGWITATNGDMGYFYEEGGAFYPGSRANTHYGIRVEKDNAYNDREGTVQFAASHSNPIYGNSSTVQPPALTLLPCIKAFSSVVGDATVIAGQLVNDIQSKVALDGSNLSGAVVKAVVETWHSGASWYRVWSDGWIEQGGYISPSTTSNVSSPKTITLPKQFSNTDYTLTIGILSYIDNTLWGRDIGVYDKTTTSFKTYSTENTNKCQGKNWYACGF